MTNIRAIFLPNENLEKIIVAEARKAKEIKVAVFFVKYQMYNKLKKHLKGKYLQFAIGCDFYHTEPKVLEDIYREISSGQNWVCKLYNFPTRSSKTFHVKMYIFKKENDDISVIIGSSNISKGGFSENFEYDILINGKRDLEIKKILDDFENIFSDGIVLDDDVLREYKREYKLIKRIKNEADEKIKSIVKSKIRSRSEALTTNYLRKIKMNFISWAKTPHPPWAPSGEWMARETFYKNKEKLIDKIKSGASLTKNELIELFDGSDSLFDLDNIMRMEGGYSRSAKRSFVEKEIADKNGVKKLNDELQNLLNEKTPVTQGIEDFCKNVRIGIKRNVGSPGIATQLLSIAYGNKYPHLNGKARKGIRKIFQLEKEPTYSDYDKFIEDMKIIKQIYRRVIGKQSSLPIYFEIDAIFEYIAKEMK